MAKSETLPPSSPAATRLTTLLAGDTAPLNTVTIRATIDRALVDRRALPRPTEVHELTRALREHLSVLGDELELRRDAHPRHSEAWYEWQAVIIRIEGDLEPAPARRSAVMHLQELARTARHALSLLGR